MDIECPKCSKRYRIPESSVGSRPRVVKCAQCSHRWKVKPVLANATIDAGAEMSGGTDPREAWQANLARVLEENDSDDFLDDQEKGASAGFDQDQPEPVPGAQTASAPSRNEGGNRARRFLPKEDAGSSSAATGRPGRGALWIAVGVIALLCSAGVVARDGIVRMVPASEQMFASLGLPVSVHSGLAFDNISADRTMIEDRLFLVVSGEIHNKRRQTRTLPPLNLGLLDAQSQTIAGETYPPPVISIDGGAISRFEISLANPPDEAVSFRVEFATAE